MDASELVYSVSQLNREAKRLLAMHFLTVRVEGEISNFMAPASGHWYFTLKDVQAQIRCAMFRGQQQRLGFKPNNGDMVVVNAQVSLYEPRGDYQLVVERMEQAGDGALRQAFERLKVKLLNDGLFDEARKRALPLIPGQIGVITSATGAAIRDILSVLKRRFPAVPVIIYPVAVQGESAQFEIRAALELANQRGEVDVLILARGGGSLEDLWAFNEEIVARAIAGSKIPVISGVGHEVDVTIADFVADLRAATPSAAAEHAVPHAADWLQGFKNIEYQLLQRLRRQLLQHQQRLAWLDKALNLQHPGQKLQRNAQRLDELEQRLTQAIGHRLQRAKQQCLVQYHILRQHQPSQRIAAHQRQLQFHRQHLERIMRQTLKQQHQRLAGLVQTLQAVSPLATLERGYAIVQHHEDGQLVKMAAELAIGDAIDIRLSRGYVTADVSRIVSDAVDAPLLSSLP